jgi:DNA-binding transcriptional regulator YhcF (GntR family)
MIVKIPILVDARGRMPLYQQIANQIRPLLIAGELEPGMQLPPVRQLAARLRVNFNTVARAYRILDREGWVRSRPGQGTFVLEQAPSAGVDEEEHLRVWAEHVLREGEKFGMSPQDVSEAIGRAAQTRSGSGT